MRRDLVRLPFPAVEPGRPVSETYGGVDGFAVHSGAPDEAVDLLRLMTSRAVQEELIQISFAVPTVSGADITIEDPFLQGISREVIESRYHQLYYDQVLGPVAGDALNKLAMAIGTRELTGRQAAAELEAVWDGVLDRRTRSLAPAGGD